MKIGVFGGSFNPPHAGHLNVVSSVIQKMGLDKVLVIPSFQNPLKLNDSHHLAEAHHRFEMSKLAFGTLSASVDVLSLEVERKGSSYTIDTLKELQKDYPKDQFYLIIGADNLNGFTLWKNWKDILSLCDLIVTTRPGWEIPHESDSLPEEIKSLVTSFDFNMAELSTGHTIHFLNLKDITVSSTDVRRLIHIGKSTSQLLTLDVENFIRDQNVYPKLNERVDDYKRLTHECINWMQDRKALNLRAFDLNGVGAISDYALIASGTSTKHVSSIAEYLKQEIKREYNVLPQAVEGISDGKWVVLDYGILVIHIFYEYVRQAYALEQLWTGSHEIAIELPKSQ